jgi:hypothetical protein
MLRTAEITLRLPRSWPTEEDLSHARCYVVSSGK